MQKEFFSKNNEHLNSEQNIIKAFIKARKNSRMTQKQLSEKTGIAQPDISKFENGNSNPSIRTLQRLATAMGMELKIDFQPVRETKG